MWLAGIPDMYRSQHDSLVNWCSRTALMNSSSNDRSAWFVSLANRKLGADIEENSCIILEHVAGDKCCT